MKKLLLIGLFLVAAVSSTFACTNFLVTKGASADGSTFISYAADSHVLYGELYHWPAATYPEGTMLDVFNWDTGKYLGQIKQATETYNVTGNMNEFQVAIGETTYGGLKDLHSNPGATMDYGSLIYITLQRAKTAREALRIMTELVSEYGFDSHGESFSISDPDEAWIFEMISKGKTEVGAVWVARRIPDGYISGHANQARIRTFPLADGKKSITFSQRDKLNNPEIECYYADDVISFAKKQGYYKGKNKDFSFSDTYAPVDFGGARFCEMRVWAFFRQMSDDMDQYTEYVAGHDLSNRMPLWIKPKRKISLMDMFHFMGDHLEGTPFDMTKDIGSGPFHAPYRWRPLTWKVEGEEYCNERATSTQQTGFVFVAQSRSWMPRDLGGIIWFGVDDAASTVFVPIYTVSTSAPKSYAVGNGDMMTFTTEAAFWVYNMVSNFAYTRYDLIHPEIAKEQQKLEEGFIQEIPKIDAKAKKLYETEGRDAAVKFLTQYSQKTADQTTAHWRDFFGYLFTKYMDGNVKEKQEVPEGYKYYAPKLEQPGYGEDWYKIIVEKTGDHFKMK